MQVGGAGLGFGAGSAAPAVGGVPGSAAQLMKEPASHRTAAAMEAGFAKGGLESTVEGTSVAAPLADASAAPTAATAQDAGTAEQASEAAPQRQVGTVFKWVDDMNCCINCCLQSASDPVDQVPIV